MIVGDVQAALDRAAAGLLVRGGFHPVPDDGVPVLPDGRAAATVVMVGNAGSALWRAFAAAVPRAAGADPLDGWLRPLLHAAARAVGGHAVRACDGPPYHPFQRWARRAEAVHTSPLGILIHPEYGLWHAYRAAFLFAPHHPVAAPHAAPSPCDGCADRPCLSGCPVGAFVPSGFDAAACLGHVDGPAGGPCRDGGCLARRACPVGRAHAYPPAAGRFHQAAVTRSLRRHHARA